jgi:hypothetical protein
MVTFARVKMANSHADRSMARSHGPLPMKEILPQVLARYAIAREPAAALALAPAASPAPRWSTRQLWLPTLAR